QRRRAGAHLAQAPHGGLTLCGTNLAPRYGLCQRLDELAVQASLASSISNLILQRLEVAVQGGLDRPVGSAGPDGKRDPASEQKAVPACPMHVRQVTCKRRSIHPALVDTGLESGLLLGSALLRCAGRLVGAFF